MQAVFARFEPPPLATHVATARRFLRIFMIFHLLPRSFAILLALATLLLPGCSRPPAAALRIGINAWPGHEFLYLAQEKGFYRAEGVEVQIIEFSSLSDCRRAYERGQVDAMAATMVEVLQAREQSTRSPQVVRVVDYSNGADVILARPGINSCAELKGKRIGVELASLGVYVLARGLEMGGLSLADVETVSMDQMAMEEAMRKGELDAIVTYPPASVKLLRDTPAITVFSTADIPGEVVDVIAVEAGINAQRPEDVAKLLRAFDRAISYTAQNPTDAHRIMAKREGITPEEFAEALTKGVKLLTVADQEAYLTPGGKISAVIDASDRILRQSGQIKGADRRGDAATATFVARK
jgi:NitT/TauT family transport system substrate-binding protein